MSDVYVVWNTFYFPRTILYIHTKSTYSDARVNTRNYKNISDSLLCAVAVQFHCLLMDGLSLTIGDDGVGGRDADDVPAMDGARQFCWFV